MTLQERLLGLRLERHHERRVRMTRAHQEQVHNDRHLAQDHLRLTPVDLGLHAGLRNQRHERLDLTHRAPGSGTYQST
jgi:hypothetical protein